MRAALLTLALGFMLTGCVDNPPAPVAPLGTWGYDFVAGTFKDQRPDDDAKLMAATPFTVQSFMQGWRHNIGTSPFAAEQAKLDITLLSYEATTSAKSYSISMNVILSGRDAQNRPRGTVNASCSAIELTDAAHWRDFWQQARTEGTMHPLTYEARNATMWQKVMDSCVKELATQFGNTLANGMH